MNTKDVEFFKDYFIKMKKNLNKVKPDSELQLKGDDIDIINSQKEYELSLKLKGRKKFFLKKIDRAMEKLEEGTFGECEECGCEISTKRLKARPTASFCIYCKEDMERVENQIVYQKKSHTHGKEIINENVVKLPIQNQEIHSENILKFKRDRQELNL